MMETSSLEFKRELSDSFLKTVCAFANRDGGRVVFGVDDDGRPVGVDDPSACALAVENKINDGVKPRPDFSLAIDETSRTVTLTIEPGRRTPYYFRSKTYKRSGTSTVEVDALELSRLILAGQNRSYEELRASSQDLSFSTLESHLKEAAGIERLTLDTLKTLQLYSDADGYSNAGALLADANPFCGIDAVRFAENPNILLDRRSFAGLSVLEQYHRCVEMYRTYYCYERIDGIERTPVQLVPEEALREAVANALVHRTWDVEAPIKVSMHPDRIEVASPGGLPSGISEREYLRGQVSILRNPILGNVFFRLGLIERFGTGVMRINDAYANSGRKPRFEVFENSLLVVLPLATPRADLAGDAAAVYDLLRARGELSSAQVAAATGFGRTKTARLLGELVAQGFIKKRGETRARRYFL